MHKSFENGSYSICRKVRAMKKRKLVSYAKWGYIFIAPFFIVYIIFQLIPLLSTFYYSFFENYRSGLNVVGPNFVGFENYVTLFTPDKNGSIDIFTYFINTIIMWLMGKAFLRRLFICQT